jgi:hypothetical protein
MSKKYTGPRVKDTESFIQKARWKHGDKYGYERVNYRGSKERVEIVCNEHGSFWQMPSKHVFGHGCAGCGGSEIGTTKTFISKARNVHGGLYDYSRVEYRNYAHKVEILCEDHGIFLQTPNAHLYGHGCPDCKRINIARSNTSVFVVKAIKVHGNKYDYSETIYTDSKIHVDITCSEHGKFRQAPNNHLKGRGCPKCAGIGLTKSEWVERFKKVHGNFYDYSELNFIGVRNKVEIVCREHGSFWQLPLSHRRGEGCLECFKDKQKKGLYWKSISAVGLKGFYGTDAPSNLYILLLNNSFIKVGLAKEIHTRMTRINRESGYSVEKLYSIPGVANELFDLEQDILRNSNLKQYYPEQSFGGASECLELSELPKVISIIEVSFLHTNTNKKHEDIAA